MGEHADIVERFECHRGLPQRGSCAARIEFGAGGIGRKRAGRAAENIGDIAGNGAPVGEVELHVGSRRGNGGGDWRANTVRGWATLHRQWHPVVTPRRMPL